MLGLPVRELALSGERESDAQYCQWRETLPTGAMSSIVTVLTTFTLKLMRSAVS